jgi:general secretion pathway protein E
MASFTLLPLAAAIEGGGYISVWKILVVLVILFVWTRLLTWVDKDTDIAYLPREPINGAFIGGAVLAFALFFILPNFWVCLAALVGVMLIEAAAYLVMRNSKVGLSDLGKQMKGAFSGGGGKKKEHKAVAGEVALIDKAGHVVTPPSSDDPDAAGYNAVQQILADPMLREAERIDMAPAQGAGQVRYQVDGMPYSATSLDLDGSQAAVQYLKQISGLDLNERRKPQKGKFKAAVDANRHEMELHTAGSAAGEFLKILVDPKKRHAFKMHELGFWKDQQEKMDALVREQGGIVIVSAPKGQGLTSSIYGVIRGHDAFLEHILTVERAPEDDLEGITQNPIPANAGPDDEFKQIDWVCSQQPDIIMLTLLESPKSAQALINFAAETGKRVYVGLRAGSTFQALDQWRKLVGDDATAIKHLRMVISGRVMRRLCQACKLGYTPDPGTVRKLNLDPAKVSKLYRARPEPMRDQKGNVIPCTFCKELRYKGRFGVYELLDIDDDVKQIVSSGGSVNQLKAVFRKQRSRFLQEQALLQVSEGETSIEEMLRVLKADQGPSAPPAASAGGGGRAAPANPKAPARPPA